MFDLFEMRHIGRYSGNDPPCVGIAQSIEVQKVHLWHSPHAVRRGSHPISDLLYQDLHCEGAYRYVKHGFISRALHNKTCADLLII